MIKIQQNDIDTKSPPTTQSVTAETLPTLLAQVLKNNDINLLSYLYLILIKKIYKHQKESLLQ